MHTPRRLTQRPLPGLTGYLAALTACAAMTRLAYPMAFQVDSANIIMLFLLTVFLVAVYLGNPPGIRGGKK